MVTDWNNLPAVKKGNLGEEIVDQYIIKMGFIPYRPIAPGAHPFDRLCAKRDKSEIFIADAKTKPRRVYYPDTGIDQRHFNDYTRVQSAHNMRVFLFFVDEKMKRIYGNFLDELCARVKIKHIINILSYPWTSNGIVYFPLLLMRPLAVISDNEATAIAQYSTRNTAYEELYAPTGIADLGVIVP